MSPGSRRCTACFASILCALLLGALADDTSGTCSAGTDCDTTDGSPGMSYMQMARHAAMEAGLLDEAPSLLEVEVETETETITENMADQRDRARVRLGVEGDLRRFASRMRTWSHEEDCETNANNTFSEALTSANLTAELTEEEKENFRSRFIEEMVYMCKHDPDIVQKWVQDAAVALEHQKPGVTDALVASINKANLGFTAAVQDWMKNYSNQEWNNLMGMDESMANPDNGSASLLQEEAEIPDTYDSATKVPSCEETVRKIHNQGTCGSCWAFGTLSAVDSRLCLATNGVFSGPKAVLSRGYTTSCSTPGGRNGCNGGWWSFVYNLLGEGIHCDRRGGGCRSQKPGSVLGTDEGCIPYFGHGSGVDHFDSKSSAPPCQSQCVKPSSYFRPFDSDLYVMPGGSSWASGALEFAGYTDKAAAKKARQHIYEKGPLPFAVMCDSGFKSYTSGVIRGSCQRSPNHCVTAIGYGTDYFASLNSWGTRWGNKGAFNIQDCLVTHWSVPPDMPTEGLPKVPGSKGPPAPGPSPGPDDDNDDAPSPPLKPRKPVWTVTSGPCTIDGQGCMMTANYKSGTAEGKDSDECGDKAGKYGPNETCTIDLLTPKSPAIEVIDFSTEVDYDILTVNGKGYSGSANETQSLQGVVPEGTMTWVSDKGFEKTGWKICPKDPRSDMKIIGHYTDKNGTTYHFYVAPHMPGATEASPYPDFEYVGKFTSPNGTVFDTYVYIGNDITPGPAPGPAPGPPAPGPAPGPPSPPTPPPGPQPKDPDAPTWMRIHNYFRCIHNTGEIGWDEDVAAGSATWAQRGQMQHAKCYKIPAPRGPTGENLAAGQADIEAAVTAWYDESPERGPGCGGHCTALLWKKSKVMGCSKKNTWNGNRPFYICRYAKSAANFGSKSSAVNMPDYSKEESCHQKYPVKRRWGKGGGGGGRPGGSGDGGGRPGGSGDGGGSGDDGGGSGDDGGSGDGPGGSGAAAAANNIDPTMTDGAGPAALGPIAEEEPAP